MSDNFSKEALLQFIEFAITKGLVKGETGRAWRVAVTKLLNDLSASEEADVRTVDVEVMGRRAANRNPGTLSPETLNTYQKRVATAISEFAKYAESPAAYKPRGTNGRTRGKPNGDRSSQTERLSKSAEASPRESSTTHGRLAYPFPLRTDFLAEVVVPRDLTVDEAKRLSAFLLALAIDYKPGQENWPHQEQE